MDELNAVECPAEKDIREVWRKVPGDHYSPSIQVFDNGNAVRFNVDGKCVTMPAEKWVDMAWGTPPPPEAGAVEEALKWADQPLDRVIERDKPALKAIHVLAAALRRVQGELTEAKEAWRCFHCGEAFSIEQEASDHFSVDGVPPMCVDPITKDEKARMVVVRKLESEILKLRKENEELDHLAGAFHAMSAELGRYFGQCGGGPVKTASQAFLVYEAMIGRAEAAESELRRLSALPSALDEKLNFACKDRDEAQYQWKRWEGLARRAYSDGRRDALGCVPAALPEWLSGIRRDVLEAARIQFKAMAWQFHATRIGHDGDYSKCENAVCDENRKLIAALASSPSAPVEKAKPVPCGFPDRHFNASFPDSCPECPPPPKDPQ